MSIFHILDDKNFDNYINDIIINDNDDITFNIVNGDANNDDDKNFEDYINNIINGNDSRSRLSSLSSFSSNISNNNNNDNNSISNNDVISMCVIDYSGCVLDYTSLYESIIDDPTNNFNIFDHLDYSKTSYEKILEIILSIENHTNTIIHMITHDNIPYVMEIFMILDNKVYLQISEKSMETIRVTRQNISNKENGGLLGVLNQQV